MATPFYFTGDLNDWAPASEEHRLVEPSQPYGRDGWGGEHPERRLQLGSLHLTLDLPAGPVRFKILEGPGWEQQWSAMPFYEREIPFLAERFRSWCGIEAGVFVPRGNGMPAHAELTTPGGLHRFDFCPHARTLAVHRHHERAPAVHVEPWRTFPCGADAVYDTWTALPYGFAESVSFPYPVVLVFDGRSLLHGEDPPLGRFHEPRRQLPRVFDALTRQGVIPPAILVAVDVPRIPAQTTPSERLGKRDRRLAFVARDSHLHQEYRRSLLERLIPALAERFAVDASPARWALLGHSWSADFALDLAAGAPERFGAVIALSPSRPAERAARFPRDAGARPRVAITYGRQDLGPSFLTEPPATARLLRERGVPHLMHFAPRASHDPDSLADDLPAALAFALGGRGLP